MLLLVKLRFQSPIVTDLSQGEEFKGIIHSDTLFSAIFNHWVKFKPFENRAAINKFIDGFNSGPPLFRISSAFPFWENNYYLPTPIGTSELYMTTLENVPFLELDDFIDLAAGNFDKIEKKRLANPLDELLVNLTAPRVTIDRITTSTNIYETTSWFVSKGGGLYLLIDLNDNSFRDVLEVSISLLGEHGLGGDRSTGYGIFVPEIIDISTDQSWLDLFKNRNGESVNYCTLSLCCTPGDSDEAKQAASYQIVTRKGWIISSSSFKQMKRKQCKMFAEGSLFKAPIKGQIVEVTPAEFEPEHDVYRYGLAMTVALLSGIK